MTEIEFFFSIGSTYSYLTVLRLAEVEKDQGVRFLWRPFNVRHVMVEQDNIPFKDKPVKAAYMWRDIERRAGKYGLAPQLPAPYPLPGLVLANQVALVGCDEGWVANYTVATYRRWFEDGLPAGQDPNLTESLRDIGQDPERVIDIAESSEIAERLQVLTEEAMVAGIFGAPSFRVGDEIFWGDDRLDDAIAWAKSGTLSKG